MNPYCVILCLERLVHHMCCPRMKRFYLRAPTADGAIQAASNDNPQWRVIGIEPSDLTAPLRQGDDSNDLSLYCLPTTVS
jgi:hypothetical protein